ncbi:MAG TPA: hypothetical protein VFE62_05990 [Gemmataceae bacterium]|nr:hypothetical protein [Gemmataceae bacterium]
MRVCSSSIVVFLALCLGTLGCGKNDREPLHPVRGHIEYDGKPVPHAFLVLHPVKATGKESTKPRAKVAEDGSFVVETYAAKDGAPAGEYVVTIEWYLSNAVAGGGESDDLPARNYLPQRYSKVETSGLRVSVQPGKNEIPTIQLTP